jgi:glycosyltransferase involved in cell wall biosynthesis
MGNGLVRRSAEEMKMTEDISVIVSIYNHAKTISQAIDSILNQKTDYKFRIYCLDDCSTDDTRSIVLSYVERFPEIVVYLPTPSNLGSGWAVHYFHKLNLPGKYWCILEGDDFWTDPLKLQKQLSLLETDPLLLACSCNTTVLDERTGQETIIGPSKNKWYLLDTLVLKHKFSFYVHTSGIIWRNHFQPTGFYFPPEYEKFRAGGDTLLAHLMLRSGGAVQNIPSAMSCYRLTGRGVWSAKSVEEQARSQKRTESRIRATTPLRFHILRLVYQALLQMNRVIRRIPKCGRLLESIANRSLPQPHNGPVF